jgi:putative ABC transport system ATP-binding protein
MLLTAGVYHLLHLGHVSLWPAMAHLEIRQVSKAFAEGGRRRAVLVDLSLAVERGEIVALTGRSGSGKSTLLNVMAGIDRPDGGAVAVAGEVVSALPERARTLFRRRQIGFVFQFFNLLPTLTVAENVLLPLDLLGRGRDGARARDLLEAVGLADRGGAFPDRLSGGEQQRVAVARALVHEPSLVLADEPTGALDAETGRAVLALLIDLARGAGRTVVLATHSAEVARAADRAFLLEGGRLTESR